MGASGWAFLFDSLLEAGSSIIWEGGWVGLGFHLDPWYDVFFLSVLCDQAPIPNDTVLPFDNGIRLFIFIACISTSVFSFYPERYLASNNSVMPFVAPTPRLRRSIPLQSNREKVTYSPPGISTTIVYFSLRVLEHRLPRQTQVGVVWLPIDLSPQGSKFQSVAQRPPRSDIFTPYRFR